MAFDAEKLTDIVRGIHVSENGSAYIIDGKGGTIAHNDYSLVLNVSCRLDSYAYRHNQQNNDNNNPNNGLHHKVSHRRIHAKAPPIIFYRRIRKKLVYPAISILSIMIGKPL